MAEADIIRQAANIVALQMLVERMLLKLIPDLAERQKFAAELDTALEKDPDAIQSNLPPTEHARLLAEISGALQKIPRYVLEEVDDGS